MKVSRLVRGAIALALLLGLVPVGAAQAAVNKPPRIKKAVLLDKDGDGLGDRIVLTYNERINHKLDTARFPFRVDGYKILKVNGARRSLKLTIILKESQSAPLKPAFVKYSRTRQQPVVDLKKKQAAKQLLNRNIFGLAAPPPPTEQFTLTVAKGGDGLGDVTSSDSKINCGSTCSANYESGSTVTLTAAPDAASNAEFAGWTGADCGTATSCTVTMDASKTVTATFNKAGSVALTVKKSGTGLGTVKSTSTPTQTQQIDCGATCTASYPKTTPPTLVTLTATPDAASKSVIAAWSGGGCTGTQSTCNVTMDAAKEVTITFNKPSTFALTVEKTGAGAGKVTSSPAGIDCGATCQAQFPANSQVTLTAEPDAATGSLFGGWSGGGCTGNANTCNVTVDQAKTVTATFNTAGQSTLTVNKEGAGQGSVSSNDSKINCGATCETSYPANSQVVLTATPAAGSVFSGWSGGGCAGTSPTCNLTMTTSRTVTATFNLVTTVFHSLTVTKAGGVGSVVSNPAGVSCPETTPTTCDPADFPEGTQVTLTATPSLGLRIKQWTGDCTGSATTCVLTMNGPKTATVEFEPDVPGLAEGTNVSGGLPTLP